MQIDWNFFLKYRPIDFIVRLYKKAFYDDIFSRAAQVAFYFSFSIFPLLFFLVSLFGLILNSTEIYQVELFSYLHEIMPDAAFDLVRTTILETTRYSSTGKLTFGFLVAIWSASAAIDSLRVALNYVYSIKETRYYWTTKSLSILLTIAFAVLLFAALGIIFYGTHLIMFVFDKYSVAIVSEWILVGLKLIIAFLVIKTLFAVIYNILPDHQTFKWQWTTQGANVGIILWLILSYSFRLYLQYFGNYARTYGSLGAMIILMLWLYLTALVILLGGAINAIFLDIEQLKTNEKTSSSVDI